MSGIGTKLSGFLRRSRSILLVLLFILAFLFGVIGFTMGGYPKSSVSDRVFSTLTMFFLNYTDPPDNALVNAARFMAALFTAGALLLLFQEGISDLLAVLKGLSKKSVFIYGDTEEAGELARQVGHRGIFGKKSCLRAGRYILLGSDEENLRFYQDNLEKLADREVYVRSRSLRRVITNRGRHTFFSLEEIAARKYWLENSLLDDAFDRDGNAVPELTVAIVGFGVLGEELLYQALQTNIFAPEQRVIYHVFGDSGEFEALHCNLEKLHVVVHHQPWSRCLELLAGADRIILPGPDALPLLEKMLYRVTGTRIDVFTRYEALAGIVGDHRSGRVAGDIRLFDMGKGICTLEYICAEADTDAAMELDHMWSGSPADTTREALWMELPAEKRYSNLSAVDYHRVQEMLVKRWTGSAEGWSACAERLAELEHIRWCHYYWYNNWKYPEAPGLLSPGQNKNEALRLHADLAPYGTLPEKERNKDRDQVKKLFQLGRAAEQLRPWKRTQGLPCGQGEKAP